MAYVDTSVLVAALTNEAHTGPAQAWLAARPANALAISDWTVSEFSAALSVKQRRETLDAATRARILGAFQQLVRESFIVHPVSRDAFRHAAQLADRHDSGLRAGGALHLAIASETGEPLVSLDRTLVASALAHGISASAPDAA